MKSFNRIGQARVAAGMSRPALAKILGMSANAVYQLEINSIRTVSAATKDRLLNCFPELRRTGIAPIRLRTAKEERMAQRIRQRAKTIPSEEIPREAPIANAEPAVAVTHTPRTEPRFRVTITVSAERLVALIKDRTVVVEDVNIVP